MGTRKVSRDLGLVSSEVLATGQDHVVAVLVELKDLGLDLLADVRGEVADATHLNEGGRQEATQTDVDDEAALDASMTVPQRRRQLP